MRKVANGASIGNATNGSIDAGAAEAVGCMSMAGMAAVAVGFGLPGFVGVGPGEPVGAGVAFGFPWDGVGCGMQGTASLGCGVGNPRSGGQ